MIHQIYYRELSLTEGFDVLAEPKAQRLVRGRLVSAPRGHELFLDEWKNKNQLKCWCCGVHATCFVATKGRNDILEKSPVLDLFAHYKSHIILMTRDHIIPRSFGGNNNIRNLRIGCVICNRERGNNMSADELKFMEENPDLIIQRKN